MSSTWGWVRLVQQQPATALLVLGAGAVMRAKCVNPPHVDVVSLLNKTYRGDVQLLQSSLEKLMPFAEVVLFTAHEVQEGCTLVQSSTGALSMRCELTSCSASRRQDSCNQHTEASYTSVHDLPREALAILAGSAGRRLLKLLTRVLILADVTWHCNVAAVP